MKKIYADTLHTSGEGAPTVTAVFGLLQESEFDKLQLRGRLPICMHLAVIFSQATKNPEGELGVFCGR